MRKKLMIKKRRSLDFSRETDSFVQNLKGKYVWCETRMRKGIRARKVSALACYRHSRGEVSIPELKEAIEEQCLGCTRWLDYLNDNKKKKRKRISI